MAIDDLHTQGVRNLHRNLIQNVLVNTGFMHLVPRILLSFAFDSDMNVHERPALGHKEAVLCYAILWLTT